MGKKFEKHYDRRNANGMCVILRNEFVDIYLYGYYSVDIRKRKRGEAYALR